MSTSPDHQGLSHDCQCLLMPIQVSNLQGKPSFLAVTLPSPCLLRSGLPKGSLCPPSPGGSFLHNTSLSKGTRRSRTGKQAVLKQGSRNCGFTCKRYFSVTLPAQKSCCHGKKKKKKKAGSYWYGVTAAVLLKKKKRKNHRLVKDANSGGLPKRRQFPAHC